MKEILVMDSEERKTFWVTLKSDYNILFATSAREGLRMLSRNVGLVFLSMRLPDMNGMEVLRRIKKEHPATAVIVTASCGAEDTDMESFRREGKDCAEKPMGAEEILEKIRMLVEKNTPSPVRGRATPSTEALHEEYYPDIPSHVVRGVLKVRDYVAKNYSESLTLIAACKMASVSKTYFCRFFKRITGHSLGSYQHVMKMQIAEELLRDKRLSVKDVAHRLGYSDANYFSTIYKRVTGSSPRRRQTDRRYVGIDRETDVDINEEELAGV
jgi:two-component system response regulator YesN